MALFLEKRRFDRFLLFFLEMINFSRDSDFLNSRYRGQNDHFLKKGSDRTRSKPLNDPFFEVLILKIRSKWSKNDHFGPILTRSDQDLVILADSASFLTSSWKRSIFPISGKINLFKKGGSSGNFPFLREKLPFFPSFLKKGRFSRSIRIEKWPFFEACEKCFLKISSESSVFSTFFQKFEKSALTLRRSRSFGPLFSDEKSVTVRRF